MIEILNNIESELQSLDDLNSSIHEIFSVSFTLEKKIKFDSFHKSFHNLKNISKFQLTNNGKSQFAVGKVDEIKLKYDQNVDQFQLPFMQLFNKIHIIKGQIKPKLYGCFPFSNKKQSSVWGNLAYPTFFLPLIDFTIEENELHITINFNSKFQIHNLIKHIKSSNNLATISKDKLNSNFDPQSKIHWIELCERAIHKINQHELEKVVLSMTKKIKHDKNLNHNYIIENLISRQINSNIFLYQNEDDLTFFGASPEILIETKSNQLQTMALAGTIKRDDDHLKDIELSKNLLKSKKEQLEHRIVLDDIIDTLSKFFDKNIMYDETPSILKLKNLQHLKTTINVKYDEINYFGILEQMHPTPALGGKPKLKAIQFIDQNESISRGLYGGYLGCIDMDFNSKLIVGIRSALTNKDYTYLFAGAGIVKSSIPESEWNETVLKYSPLLDAMEVQ